jgi:hypothetical protein
VRDDFKFELVYGSHLQPDIITIKQFGTEKEADEYWVSLLDRLDPFEQINYWVRPVKVEH